MALGTKWKEEGGKIEGLVLSKQRRTFPSESVRNLRVLSMGRSFEKK